jgi:hypothetical protein
VRLFVLALLLGIFASPAQAQVTWTDIGTAEEGTVVRVGYPVRPSVNGPPYVMMDSAVIFQSAQMLPDGQSYRAILYHNDFECSRRRYSVPSLIYFADAELNREVLWDPVHTEWIYPEPNSIGEMVLRAACG